MNNSSNIKSCIKKPMVALLVSLLLVISIPFSVYADSSISLGQYYSGVTGYASYNSTTDVVEFNSRYAYSGVGFNLPNESGYYTLVSHCDYLYIQYFSSNNNGSMFSGITLNSGDSVQIYSNTNQSTDLYISVSNTDIPNVPNPFILSNNVSLYLGDAPPAVIPPSGYTNIESGNIVYFDLGNGTSYDIDLESQFYSSSGIISGTWSDDNRRYGFASELPVVNTNFGETSGSSILWTKSSKGQNILGQTKIGESNITGTTSAKYLWIINPMYNNRYFEDNLDAKSLNGLITVTGVPAGTIVYTYKLKQNASSIGLESTIPDVSGGMGTVSDTTGTQTTYVSTDDNETPYTQTVGGDNSAPEEVTATEGIRQTLDQLSSSFSSLFLAPVEYIQILISSGSAFMQTLGGIFNWLPEPVVSVFLSALVLMIVIGVIKMLL